MSTGEKAKRVIGIILIVFCAVSFLSGVAVYGVYRPGVLWFVLLIIGITLVRNKKVDPDAPVEVTHNYGMPLEENQKCSLRIGENSVDVDYDQSHHTILYKTITNASLDKKERAIQVSFDNNGITSNASFRYSDYQSARLFVERANIRIRASANSNDGAIPELTSVNSNINDQKTDPDVEREPSQLESHEEQSDTSSNPNAPNTTIDLMYCYNCGARLREGSIYCENCGQKL